MIYPEISKMSHSRMQSLTNRKLKIIGIGESTHGTSEFISGRFQFIINSIMKSDAPVNIFLEADFVCTINLLFGLRDSKGVSNMSLARTGAWALVNNETRDSLINLIDYKGSDVCIFGTDYNFTYTFDEMIRHLYSFSDKRMHVLADNLESDKEIGKMYLSSYPYRDVRSAKLISHIVNIFNCDYNYLNAHNLHISRDGYKNEPTIGSELSEMFGAKYLSIGQYCYSGSFIARHALSDNEGLEVFELDTPPTRSLENRLALINSKSFIVNSDVIKREDNLRYVRGIGSTWNSKRWHLYYYPCDVSAQHDFIAFSRHSTPFTRG